MILGIALLGCQPKVEQQQSRIEPEPKNTEIQLIRNEKLTSTGRVPVYISRNQGRSWEPVSEGLNPDIQVSFLEPFGDEILMATDNDGLYISYDNRTRWKPIGSGLPGKKINSLYLGEATFYAGVYGQGLFRSLDKGQTWEAYNFNLPDLRVQSILEVGDLLLVGTDSGIFQLDAQNQFWILSFPHVQVLSLNHYEGKFVAGTNQGSLLSENGPGKWRWINQQGAVHYTILIDQTIIEMVIMGNLNFSNDWGASWQQGIYSPNAGTYVYQVAKVGSQYILSNNYGVSISDDGGLTWSRIFETELMGFFDFLVIDNVIYGGTRSWNESRGK
ncbi:MAG: hypothetical protein AAF502_09425 [Bacteroidota bacterium]